MVDLTTNFAGLELNSPFIVASSETVRDIRQIKKAEKCGASAVILKAMGPPGSPLLYSKLRTFVDVKGQAIYGIGGSRWLSYDQGVELVMAAKKETGIKIGVNMAFPMIRDYQLVVDAVARLAEAGADFIELNFKGESYTSTLEKGKMDTERSGTWEGIKGYGEYVDKYLSRVAEGTRTIKQVVSLPVVGKIDPQMGDIVVSALAMQSGGANAVDAANIMGGSIAVDIYNGGTLKMPGAKKALLNTVGTPYKPFAQGFVARLARAINIPILGSGGLMNWQDAVEMIMFGATAVSFCSVLMMCGFEAISEIEKGLRAFMERQGYRQVDDFRGLALEYIMPDFQPEGLIPSVARIDEDKCIGCGRCLKQAHCLAISQEHDKAVVDPAECLGCGSCSLLCPETAVSMIEI
jgi:dihydropyrimidine dehydrogenase (NAD+) subunit PreA